MLYESDTEGKSQRKTSLTNPVVLPENYNGDGVWEDHKQNIEACASVNGWNKEQQVQFLAVSLVGPARELLLGVPLKSSIAYSILLRRLREKYSPGEHSNLDYIGLYYMHEDKKKEKDQEN